jgi:hypothetical protein
MTIACNRQWNGRGTRSISIWPKGRMHLQTFDKVVDETAYTHRWRICDDFQIARSDRDRQYSLRASFLYCCKR